MARVHKNRCQTVIPASLLGSCYKAWQKGQIRAVLDHFEWPSRMGDSKLQLWNLLQRLINEQALTRNDKLEILEAYRTREILGPQSRQSYRRWRLHRALPQGPQSTVDNDCDQDGRIDFKETRLEQSCPCSICFESLDNSNTPTINLTSSCQHERIVCSTCIATSIATQINDKIWDKISCPTCGEHLGYHDIQTFADQVTFERYAR